MIAKTARPVGTKSTASETKAPRSRLTLSTCLVLIAVTAMLVAFAGAPYVFQTKTIQNEIAKQLRATTGLIFASTSDGRFALLPRPRVMLGAFHVTDPNGTLTIDADALEGEVRMLPLIVGRIELVAATLKHPNLVIDLDGRPMSADSLIGRTMRGVGTPGSDGPRRLGIISLEDGIATLKSRALAHPARFTDVDVTLDWRDLDSPATLTGTLQVQNIATDIATWIAQPASLMSGGHSAVSFHLHSAPIDLSASGDLIRIDTTAFRGHLTATAPSITSLGDLVGGDLVLLAPFADFALDTDAAIDIDRTSRTSVNLQNVTMHADDNEYEGTLAMQLGQKPSLSGTLASEQLTLSPFLGRVPKLVDAEHRWSSLPILDKPLQLVDLDLRLSATHVRAGRYGIDDTALAIITRGGQTEITLAEGKAYGGTLRGRVSIGVAGKSIGLHATGTLNDADISALAADTTGRQVITGKVSTSFNVDTSGESPASIMTNLQGSMKSTVLDGELAGLDFAGALREASKATGPAVMTALRSGDTPFRKLTLAAQLTNGVATIDDSTMSGQTIALALGGSADIGRRGFNLVAIATPTGAPASAKAPGLRLEIGGTFDKPIVFPVVSAPPTAPAGKSR